ncbi:MAG: radical SAM family heme chaperone HemW [Firmicutes bacterium]|nr:radical SAM family heme chaperone HemW [Bacillota bacterium]
MINVTKIHAVPETGAVPENNLSVHAGETLALYLHIPYCRRRCGYCDFNTYAVADRPPGEPVHYVEALGRELRRRFGDAGAGLARREIISVYVGGGTPTSLPGELLSRTLRDLLDQVSAPGGCEVTMEANPETLTPVLARQLVKAGVNRLSLGVQATQGRVLRVLERNASPEAAPRALATAREAGFDNIGVDLLWGIPRQSEADWEGCLEWVAAQAPDHVSAYGLEIHPGTPLGRALEAGRVAPPEEEKSARMYETARSALASLGYEHYEIANFALPGRRCRHNQVYWRNREYLGLGAGAWSYLERRRFSNLKDPGAYMDGLAAAVISGAGGIPEEQGEDVTEEMERADTVILGLRMLEGVSGLDFQERFRVSLTEIYGSSITRLASEGLLTADEAGIRLTPRGLLLANEVFASFLP